MATSPIYNWPEPDNTDLVKNGALAIRTLGNAIDTTMGTMTAKSIVDAKGDLIAASANDTPARLAVGADGTTLVADSSTSTGLRYQVPVNANPVLNSAFQVWQRSISVAVNGGTKAYVADRFEVQTATASVNTTTTRQSTGDTTNLPFIQYCARVQRNSGVTANGYIQILQSIETLNSLPYAGKTVTLSFYARKGANFSEASSQLGIQIVTGTGTDQNVTAYTGSATPVTGTATLTTTWQRFTFTGSLSSSLTELGLNIYYLPTGTAGAADYFEITGVQLEVGSVATPFKTYAGTIQGELAACQRYFYAITADGVNNGAAPVTQFGLATATGTAQFTIPTPVTMRTAPSASFSSLTGFRVYDAVNAATVSSSIALSSAGSQPNGIIISVSAPSLTQYRPYYLIPAASATNYIYMNAEL